MVEIRQVVKKAANPVTGRLDNYLAAMVEQVHEAKDSVLAAITASDARAAERHFAMSARIAALENEIAELKQADQQ